MSAADAFAVYDPTVCEVCGRDSCEDHLPPAAAPVEPNPPRAEGPSPRRPATLDPLDPLHSARAFLDRHFRHQDMLTLRHQAGVFYRYDGAAYLPHDEHSIRSDVYQFLDSAESAGANGRPCTPFRPTRAKVDNVLDALRSECHLPEHVGSPSWLQGGGPDPLEMVPLRNGLLNIPQRALIASTPAFFSVNALDFAYDTQAGAPAAWLAFLDQLWPHDAESIATLQEWIGHLLTPCTKFQKILMIVGPKRGGKGTIARITRRLLGDHNVCAPTLGGLGESFGLSCLIGRTAAIIADARIGGRTDAAVLTERLLSISGEDGQTIARKFKPDWNGRLTTRFMVLTNELPRVEDSSGALASRFLVLRLQASFFGREDHNLDARLAAELPAIFNWALDGFDRLHQRGRFHQPQASVDLIQEFEDLGSPIAAFVRDRCDVGPTGEVMQERVFESWRAWCVENGRDKPGTTQTLARNLRAALPWITLVQHRIAGRPTRFWAGLRLKEGSHE